jgi:hypothetical protein
MGRGNALERASTEYSNSGKLTSNHEHRRRRPWHLGRWISTAKVDEKSGREDIYNKFYLIYVCEF